jgi:hypothetical protein
MKWFLLAVLILGAAVGAVCDDEVCKEQSRPDCGKAVVFFDNLQRAIVSNDRNLVATMVHFPLRVMLHGNKAVIRNRAEFLGKYDSVFDASVRCAIAHAKRSLVWGNWQGFTVAGGVVWWERSNTPDSSFKLITVNNGAHYEGCGETKKE